MWQDLCEAEVEHGDCTVLWFSRPGQSGSAYFCISTLVAASSLMSTSSRAIRAKVIPVYRAILRELYQAVCVLYSLVPPIHPNVTQSIEPRPKRSRATALKFRAILESSTASNLESTSQNIVTFLRSQRMYKVSPMPTSCLDTS